MKLHIKQLTKNRVLLAGVSIALAAGISFVIVPTYQKNSTETVKVVSAAHNVAKGEKLSSDNLKEVEIPKKFLPGGVVSVMDEAIGEYAAVDLKAGDWLTYEKLSETTALQEWYSKLNAENVAISVTVKSLAAGVSAQLQPGDIIFYSYESNGRYRNISHVAIYIGNNEMVHAANPSRGVVRDPFNPSNLTEPLYARPQ